MHTRRPVTWMLLTSLVLASCPASLLLAQGASDTGHLTLSPTRGRVEILVGSGQWERLHGPQDVQVGTAIRTAVGAEAVARFPDGSTITLGQGSALRFNSVTGGALMKVLGQLSASISPDMVAHDTIAFDTPVGRATINRAFSEARAVRPDVAASQTTVQLQTPTARSVRLAVSQGSATLQGFSNLSGLVTSTDPGHASFILTETTTGRAHRVVVGANTLLATRTPTGQGKARAYRTPQDLVQALATRQSVTVYGTGSGSEGPGALAQANAPVFQALLVFPDGSDYLSAEDFVASPDLPVAGAGVAASSGNTLSLTAGSVTPAVAAGTALTGTIATQVGLTSATGLAAASPLAIGIGVVAVAAAVTIVSNDNKSNNNNNTIQTNTTALNLQISRVSSRARATAGLSSSPIQPASSILVVSPFRGSTVGPTVSFAEDGLAGRLPLTGTVQLHAAAQVSHIGTESNMTQVDLGVDWLLSPNRSLGAALVTRNVTVLDGVANGTSNTTTPEVRYTVRF